ncbi:MAG: hypothetical protein KAJ18_11500 [Candidatus Omnitrophica bacterium]|nr:hypothetical protein [Candidatus Omnitrophota bacterium]
MELFDFDVIVRVFLAALLVAVLLPGSFTAIFGVNTFLWSEGAIILWQILPVLLLIVILLILLKKAGYDFDM